MKSKWKPIILDMDATLIGEEVHKKDPNNREFVIRPFLEEFLYFCFENFQTVSIWTNGTESWFQHVYQTALKNYLPEGKSFYLTKTYNDCRKEWATSQYSSYLQIVKLVEPIMPADFNGNNILVVDDSKETVYQGIPETNIFRIRPFAMNMEGYGEDDTELMGIVLDLQKKLLETE